MAPQVGTTGRTFRFVFEFPVLKKKCKPKRAKKSRKYRNPICLALEWKKEIENGECSSQAELARRLEVSRARVSQVLRILRLDQEVLKDIASLGDPLPSPIVSERMLGRIISLPAEEQGQRLEAILMDNVQAQLQAAPAKRDVWNHRNGLASAANRG